MPDDIFQQRYLEHQARKAKILTSDYGIKKYKKYTKEEQRDFFEVLRNRCSQRVFNNGNIDTEPILKAIETSPSSCGRKGVSVRVISDRKDKDILSGLLVGGTGWCHRGDIILLLMADMNCYKNPAEVSFMPYLDAGVIIQTTYLTCEVLNYGCCYVNPNIREENQEFFKKRFNILDNELFCGALILGQYSKKHKT